MESMRHNILLSAKKQIKNLVKTIQMEGCVEAEQAVRVGVIINSVSRGQC